MATISEISINKFEEHIYLNEKSKATVYKYKKAVEEFAVWLDGQEITKQKLLEYRDYLLTYKKAQTVNGDLSAIHAYLKFAGMENCKVKFLKVQRKVFVEESRELTEDEYRRLLGTAKEKGKYRLYLLIMTLCSTGIRVSELPFITVEAVKNGRAEIRMKGKCRTVLIPKALRKKLVYYAENKGITTGYIFITKNGKPLDRTNICHDMKKLCETAKVEKRKVFPHNLRHLFARCFIAVEKNISHLADVLGHSRIETTRLYVAVSAREHNRILEQMKLVI